MDSNLKDQVVFKQPKTFDERKKLVGVLVDRMKYRMPVAIDSIEGHAEKAFAAWPERLYVIGRDGRILYKGGMGPFGFHPEEAEKALVAHLGS